MKRIILFTAAGAALMTLAASCAGTKNMSINELSGRWEITAVNGKEVKLSAPDARAPYLGFDVVNGRLSGNAGCNTIMGGFATDGPAGGISFSDVATTRMMCPDMDVEQSVLQALGKVTGYRKVASERVALVGDNGVQLLTLGKIKAEIEPGDLSGTWRIKELAGKELAQTAEASYSVTFDAGRRMFSCSTGCNVLGGGFTSDYSDFRFDLSTSTMMMCPDTSVEDSLKKVLPSVTSYGRLAGGGVGFYSDANELVMVLEKL